jgi:hypothetical protein
VRTMSCWVHQSDLRSCKVKIHDVQSNSRRQLDLLVMENLFYKQDITLTYDLKGIGPFSLAAVLLYTKLMWVQRVVKCPSNPVLQWEA